MPAEIPPALSRRRRRRPRRGYPGRQAPGQHLRHAAAQPQPDAEVTPLITSLASTGTATGRPATGSLTMTAAITQLLPYPASARPGAEPSWDQPAARTFFPRRDSASSSATVTGYPAGTSSATPWAAGYPDCRATPGPGGRGFRAVYPCPHRSTRDNHTLLVTFARLHGAELAADGLTAASEPASLAAELKAHLADPATTTLYRLPCQARARKPAPA
jgi:hypothetical protein